MLAPKPPFLLNAIDTRVLATLKQGEALMSSGRYEWATLDKLHPVERLMHTLAEGPALDLSRQDEFALSSPPNQFFSASYVVNKRGRLWYLHLALEKFDDVLKSIPVTHLSPHAQAFYHVLLQPDAITSPSDIHHGAVRQAVADTRFKGISRPKAPFHSPLWLPEKKFVFTQEEAQDFLTTTNNYLCHLSAVLKHPDMKRAQRLRKRQAEKHYRTLQRLFKKTLEKASPVLHVYLELEIPNLDKKDENGKYALPDVKKETSDAYHQLNEARKAFLKPRQHDPLFHGLISYAWKYRYSYGRGLTCMMALFYDAQQETQQYSLTHALGLHWTTIAGKGSNYSSPITNGNQKTQEQFFGLIDANSLEATKGLEALAFFMGYYQLYVKPTAPKHMHTFDISRMPGVTSTKRKKRPTPKSEKGKEARQSGKQHTSED